MSDEEFMQMLADMTDVQLAERLEAGGKFFAPNPHYVLEAAKRLRERDEKTSADIRVKRLSEEVERLKNAMRSMRLNLIAVVHDIGIYAGAE